MKRPYLITALPGLTPFAQVETMGQALASAVHARRMGLDGRISARCDTIEPSARMEATQDDCDEAIVLLGWDKFHTVEPNILPLDANRMASHLMRC